MSGTFRPEELISAGYVLHDPKYFRLGLDAMAATADTVDNILRGRDDLLAAENGGSARLLQLHFDGEQPSTLVYLADGALKRVLKLPIEPSLGAPDIEGIERRKHQLKAAPERLLNVAELLSGDPYIRWVVERLNGAERPNGHGDSYDWHGDLVNHAHERYRDRLSPAWLAHLTIGRFLRYPILRGLGIISG